MRIRIIQAENYRQQDGPRLRSALNHFYTSVNSVHFREMIFNHDQFETDDGFSNEEIYRIIMAGREIGTNVNNTADLELIMDDNFSTDAVGYTFDIKIFTFRNMFDNLLTTSLAGHYAHEYCHTLGFRDPDNLNYTGNNVPYEVGRIISQLAIENKLLIRLHNK